MTSTDRLYAHIENLEMGLDDCGKALLHYEDRIEYLQNQLEHKNSLINKLAEENKKLKTDNEKFILRRENL